MVKRLMWLLLLVIPVLAIVSTATGAAHAQRTTAQPAPDPSCFSSSPCVEWDNNSAGPGVRGVSLKGNGVAGWTEFNSTSSSNKTAGLAGSDKSTSGKFNSGVSGLSVRGSGISGQSTTGDGVFGSSASYVGVYGASNSYLGVFGKGPAYGVVGSSTNGVGVYGTSNTSDAVRGIIGSGVPASFHAGVAGLDSSSSGSTDEGVYGQTNLGIGVQAVALGSGMGLVASSGSGVGADIVGGSGGSPALSIVGNGGDLVDACLSGTANPCDSSHEAFQIDASGTVWAKQANFCNPGCVNISFLGGYININGGEYEKDNTCVAGCSAAAATSPGRAVVSYVATQSLPTIDDFGEASLQNGYSFVQLNPAFANVIDHSANYLVFITPEGDSRGLYVTQKTFRGFAVRENMGGHSSLTFSYRIVAKPIGKQPQRLPMVEVPATRERAPKAPMFHLPAH